MACHGVQGSHATSAEPASRRRRPPALRHVIRAGLTRPLTTASPKPSAASTRMRSRRPVDGSAEKATPAHWAFTISHHLADDDGALHFAVAEAHALSIGESLSDYDPTSKRVG